MEHIFLCPWHYVHMSIFSNFQLYEISGETLKRKFALFTLHSTLIRLISLFNRVKIWLTSLTPCLSTLIMNSVLSRRHQHTFCLRTRWVIDLPAMILLKQTAWKKNAYHYNTDRVRSPRLTRADFSFGYLFYLIRLKFLQKLKNKRRKLISKIAWKLAISTSLSYCF